MRTTESEIESHLLTKLAGLKYTPRPDIRDRAALEANFRRHFQALNKVTLTDPEFARLLDDITNQDVYIASQTLRDTNSFVRDDDTPLNYTLVNTKDWCKNTFEVVNFPHTGSAGNAPATMQLGGVIDGVARKARYGYR